MVRENCDYRFEISNIADPPTTMYFLTQLKDNYNNNNYNYYINYNYSTHQLLNNRSPNYTYTKTDRWNGVYILYCPSGNWRQETTTMSISSGHCCASVGFLSISYTILSISYTYKKYSLTPTQYPVMITYTYNSVVYPRIGLSRGWMDGRGSVQSICVRVRMCVNVLELPKLSILYTSICVYY